MFSQPTVGVGMFNLLNHFKISQQQPLPEEMTGLERVVMRLLQTLLLIRNPAGILIQHQITVHPVHNQMVFMSHAKMTMAEVGSGVEIQAVVVLTEEAAGVVLEAAEVLVAAAVLHHPPVADEGEDNKTF